MLDLGLGCLNTNYPQACEPILISYILNTEPQTDALTLPRHSSQLLVIVETVVRESHNYLLFACSGVEGL